MSRFPVAISNSSRANESLSDFAGGGCLMGEMHAKSDAELLRDYSARGDESAFREIVHRHADVVYASACRQVNSPDLAHDVAQDVFTDLARKAPLLAKTLTTGTSLLGWLYRSTRFAALNHLRDDRRRRSRERQAMQDFDPSPESMPEWDRVRPILDEAMADLDDEDREALLLRYFKNHDFRTIGAEIGVSDDTAQKRVSRALDRLRAEFNRRGISTTAVALSTALSVNAAPAAPIGLATALSSAALAGTTLATATEAIVMTTLQKSLIAATVLAAIGIILHQAHLASDLRRQVQMLQEQKTFSDDQFQQLIRDRTTATGQVATLRDENERLKGNTRELLRLRGEIGLLKQQTDPIIANNGTKGLIEWLEEYDTTTRSLTPEAQNAIRRMGANSLPELLDMLRSAGESLPIRGSTLRGIVGAFQVLGPVARSAVPTLTELLNASQAPAVRRSAALCLGAIGPDAQAAIPALIAAMGEEKGNERVVDIMSLKLNSMNALTRIGGDPLPLVAAFTACLDDLESTIRFEAAGYLQKFGSDAKSAVPQLVQILNKPDEFPLVLKTVARTLEVIGPTTNNPAPALAKLLSNKDEGVRISATNALRRLDPQAAARAGVN